MVSQILSPAPTKPLFISLLEICFSFVTTRIIISTSPWVTLPTKRSSSSTWSTQPSIFWSHLQRLLLPPCNSTADAEMRNPTQSPSMAQATVLPLPGTPLSHSSTWYSSANTLKIWVPPLPKWSHHLPVPSLHLVWFLWLHSITVIWENGIPEREEVTTLRPNTCLTSGSTSTDTAGLAG